MTPAVPVSPINMDPTTLVGGAAAICTTVSYFPQLKKCWDTGKAGDLSLKMFAILATGVALWAVYGFMKSDVVIIAANLTSLVLLMGILSGKSVLLADVTAHRSAHRYISV
jgi:MtN3 and saliva related transmembrane protein